MSNVAMVPESVAWPAEAIEGPARKEGGNSVFSNIITIFECFRKYASISYGIRPAGSPG